MSAHPVIDSAEVARTYAAVASDVDLVVEGKAPCRAIRIGGAGDLALVNADGSPVTIPGLLAGETLHLRATKLLAVGTTASKVTVLW